MLSSTPEYPHFTALYRATDLQSWEIDLQCLRQWQRETPYGKSSDWIFTSARMWEDASGEQSACGRSGRKKYTLVEMLPFFRERIIQTTSQKTVVLLPNTL